MNRAARVYVITILFILLLPGIRDAALAHEGQYRGPLDELRNNFRGANPRLRPNPGDVDPGRGERDRAASAG